MIIELEDDYGDDASLDTDTVSREELTKAFIALSKQWRRLDTLFERRAEALEASGLDFMDTMKRTTLGMADPEKAFAWLMRAHAEFIEEQIDKRRRDELEAPESNDEDVA